MDMKELPIGVQTFEDIVSGNYYYSGQNRYGSSVSQ